ncbi:iron-containing alcohol dehydrogenase [Anaeromicropila populeti]|uniref:Alcohol dehydrogenase, class IV n=1 Tax=Anaeromicropila populeti TaxID=37658 RepID=A0A1I6HM87_9FIRM|nr:iron-containing alcohol dehydrogenase [Anaeromicropila populeti]SFR55589.1 Alcohol dehydrogenase, class IV [Anaeromicropila populeti]
MKDFIFKCPTRIIYGEGKSFELHQLCRELKAEKIIIVTGKRIEKTKQFQTIWDKLVEQKIEVTVFSDTKPEPPVADVDLAAEKLREAQVDLVIAVGGGSVMDMAKAMCMLKTNEGSCREYLFGGNRIVEKQSLPLICVPTTAGSGSEVTASSVISDEEKQCKLSITHEYLVPKIAVVDPMIQLDMPVDITASTGMDALTHAIEAYVSKNANPLSDMYAEMTIKLIGKSLRTAVFRPTDVEARGNMALASTLGAVAFLNGGLGAVHGISQAMGGIAHVSHGMANAMMLPYVMNKNRKGNIEKFSTIASLLGENIQGLSLADASHKAIDAVKAMISDFQIPQSLGEVGITKDMFPAIVKGTMEYRLLAMNPVSYTEEIIYQILDEAMK